MKREYMTWAMAVAIYGAMNDCTLSFDLTFEEVEAGKKEAGKYLNTATFGDFIDVNGIEIVEAWHEGTGTGIDKAS